MLPSRVETGIWRYADATPGPGHLKQIRRVVATLRADNRRFPSISHLGQFAPHVPQANHPSTMRCFDDTHRAQALAAAVHPYRASDARRRLRAAPTARMFIDRRACSRNAEVTGTQHVQAGSTKCLDAYVVVGDGGDIINCGTPSPPPEVLNEISHRIPKWERNMGSFVQLRPPLNLQLSSGSCSRSPSRSRYLHRGGPRRIYLQSSAVTPQQCIEWFMQRQSIRRTPASRATLAKLHVANHCGHIVVQRFGWSCNKSPNKKHEYT